MLAWATSECPAQTYINTEWVQSIGSPDAVIPWTASTLDAASNLIVVGNTQVAPGNTDILVTKYNSTGDLLWQQTYNGTANGNDYGVAVQTTSGGDIFIAATATNTGNDQDLAILKYNAAGVLQWASTWDGPSGLADVPSDMAIDAFGNVFVCGATFTSPALTDYALVKFSAAGAFQWAQTYDHIGLIDAATSVKLDAFGHPIITGGSASAVNSWDYATLRYNGTTGAGMDTVRVALPGVGLDQPMGMSMDEAGNIYVTGYRSNSGQKDIQTLKFLHNLELAWVVDYDGTGYDDAGQAVAADASGNVYVAGYIGNQHGGSDFITIKYNAGGGLVWQKRHRVHSTSWKAQATKIAVSGTRIVVTGSAVNGSSLDYATVCYNSAGTVMWSKTHDAAGDNDLALALAVGNNAVYYVSGITEGPSGPAYTTVKYDVYHHEPDAVLDSLDNPLYFDDEVLVKVRGHLVDTNFVDRVEMQHTTLDRLVPDSVADVLAGAFGMAATRVKVMKVFRRMTRADSISISRLGDAVRLPEYWSVFKMSAPSTDPLVVADSLLQLPDLAWYAHPNAIAQPHSNDPLYTGGLQASLAPTTGFPNGDINIEPAWALQTGRPDIRVGVIDNPINWNHEDLMHNGVSKVVAAYNYWELYDGSMQPDLNQPYTEQFAYSDSYHGTACAGIIGALRNNDMGMAGIAGGDVDGTGNTGVSLVSLIIGTGNTYMAQDGMAAAIVEGSSDIGTGNGFACHVLSTSVGFRFHWPEGAQAVLVEAVRTAHQNGAVLAASMGNIAEGDYPFTNYPTSFTDPIGAYTSDYAVLGVGGSNQSGTHGVLGDVWYNGQWVSIEANYGPGIDLVAPGSTNIVSSLHDVAPFNCPASYPAGYHCFIGTSAAAPHVAGAAALMMAQHSVANGSYNDLVPDDVEHILENYATDVETAGYDELTGHGRLNAGAALQMVSDPYCVKHPQVPHYIIDQVQMAPQTVYIPPIHPWGIPTGAYNGYRTEVTLRYDVPEPAADAEVIGLWGHEGRIKGTDEDASGHPWASFSYVINGPVIEVTAVTNCWYLEDVMIDGTLTSGYFPAPPAGLSALFSLHLYKGSCWTPVAIEEQAEESGILLYPNPTTGDLQLQAHGLQGDGWQLQIVDALGRMVYTTTLNASQIRSTIPTHGLAQGTYALRLHRNGESHVRRFIKQ